MFYYNLSLYFVLLFYHDKHQFYNLLFDDVVELFSATEALITLKIPSTNQITGNKTGAREYVELRVKKYSLGNRNSEK